MNDCVMDDCVIMVKVIEYNAFLIQAYLNSVLDWSDVEVPSIVLASLVSFIFEESNWLMSCHMQSSFANQTQIINFENFIFAVIVLVLPPKVDDVYSFIICNSCYSIFKPIPCRWSIHFCFDFIFNFFKIWSSTPSPCSISKLVWMMPFGWNSTRDFTQSCSEQAFFCFSNLLQLCEQVTLYRNNFSSLIV